MDEKTRTVAERLLAFARTKPAEEMYNSCDIGACAFARFRAADGVGRGEAAEELSSMPELEDVALESDNPSDMISWGSLVTRLERALGEDRDG